MINTILGQNSNYPDWIQAYRPFFFESLSGITSTGVNQVLLCDQSRGMLTEINVVSGVESFKLAYNVDDYFRVDSICYYDGYLYSTYKNKVYIAHYHSDKSDRLKTEVLFTIPKSSDLTGITVTESKIYLATRNQSLLVYNRKTEEVEAFGKMPGIGIDDLCEFQENLYIVDNREQTIYVFDLNTNEILHQILTPFENPTGITKVYNEQAKQEILYIAYSRPSFEVYDTGDSQFKLQLRTYYDSEREQEPITDNFIYPLLTKYNNSRDFVLSNGFLVEMYYVEKLHALPEVIDRQDFIKDLEWKISVPMNTDRQELLALEKIGHFDMRIEEIPEEDNRKVAVFSIPEIDLKQERRVFGWKALVKMYSIRYCIDEEKVREITEEERDKYSRYLRNSDGLDLDSWYVQEAAQDAVKHLSEKDQKNVLKKAKAIRNYVYKNLTYVMDNYHEGTEDILRSGAGSCGEYLNVFLSLFRLNDIPARECGNYKIPAYKMQPGSKSVFLSPDFNHVWLQFYVPGFGWVPLESSADDEAASFREWSKRYFMALSWYHMECRMGSYFEEVFEKSSNKPFFHSAGELAKNDIKFKVIRELDF